MNPQQQALKYFLNLPLNKRSELVRHRSIINIPHTTGLRITVDNDPMFEYDHVPVIEMLEWVAEEYGKMDKMEKTYKEQYHELLDLVDRMLSLKDTLQSAQAIEEILRKRIIKS